MFLQPLAPVITCMAVELRSPEGNLKYKWRVREELTQEHKIISARKDH